MNLTEYISHPETMDEMSLNALRRIVDRYPYFQPARLLYLRNLYQLHDPAFDKELRRAAIYIADRKALFMLIEGIITGCRLIKHKLRSLKTKTWQTELVL